VSGRKKITVTARLLVVLAAIGVVVAVQLSATHSQHHPKPKSPLQLPPVAPRAWRRTPQPLGIKGHWKFVLNDEFNGRVLDTSIWRAGWYGTGRTGSPNVLEDDCYDSANVTFPGDGSMHMAVTAEPSRCEGRKRPYTGAVVSTNPRDGRRYGGFEYRYGVLEARMFIPGIGGRVANWPGLWADGYHWPYDGEDDVMEGVGGSACFHFHSPHFARHGPGGCAADFRPGWNTFAADWRPGSVSYYYDGHLLGTVTEGVTDKPMFIVIDNTVWRNEAFLTRPATLKVDYVRVWQPAAPHGAHADYGAWHGPA
jgi:beta-glucanase (GH16 family)